MRILTLIMFTTITASAAHAAERCDVPTDQWQPREALQKKLEAEGWTVEKIKTEDGCYEAYATNAKGKKIETFFNPKTFEAVGNDG